MSQEFKVEKIQKEATFTTPDGHVQTITVQMYKITDRAELFTNRKNAVEALKKLRQVENLYERDRKRREAQLVKAFAIIEKTITSAPDFESMRDDIMRNCCSIGRRLLYDIYGDSTINEKIAALFSVKQTEGEEQTPSNQETDND